MQRPCAGTPFFTGARTTAPGNKAAATLEAKPHEKGVPCKKPVVGKKGKAGGIRKQKKPLVRKKPAATKKPAA